MASKMQKRERELIQDGFRYALSLTHNRDEAEDLVQEAWLKMHQNRKITSNIRYYLYSVIRNSFIDSYRKNRRFSTESSDTLSEPCDSENLIMSKVTFHELEHHLAKLKPHEREILFLKYFEEYTANEISNLTGEPRGSVLSPIHRAKNKLSKLMGNDQEDTETDTDTDSHILPFNREVQK